MFLFSVDSTMQNSFFFDGYLLISQGNDVEMNSYCNFDPFLHNQKIYNFGAEFERLFAYDLNNAEWTTIEFKWCLWTF